MAELGMFGCLLNVHIDLQNSFKTYFLYFHDIKIDLRPKNKETFFFIIPMLPTVYCLRLYSKSFLANMANLEIRKIKTFKKKKEKKCFLIFFGNFFKKVRNGQCLEIGHF